MKIQFSNYFGGQIGWWDIKGNNGPIKLLTETTKMKRRRIIKLDILQ